MSNQVNGDNNRLTVKDYLAVVGLIFFPPIGLLLFFMRRSYWTLYLAWQEYLFTIISIVFWSALYGVSKNIIYGIFTANIVIFFVFIHLCFMDKRIVGSIFERLMISTVPVLLATQIGITVALDWGHTKFNDCSQNMSNVALSIIAFSSTLFYTLPTIIKMQPLFHGMMDNHRFSNRAQWDNSLFAMLTMIIVAPFIGGVLSPVAIFSCWVENMARLLA